MTPSVRQPQTEAEPNGHRTAAEQPPAEVTERSRFSSVPLRRLLGIATLTPPQAAHIMVEVLTLLQPESESYGAFTTDDVLIDETGSIRVAAHPFTPGTASAAAELARRLARNADRPAARNRPTQAALLTALAVCADGLAAGDLAGPLTELRRELEAGAADRERLTGELAALVAVPLVRVGAEPLTEPTSDPAPVVTIVEPLPEPAEPELVAVPVLDRPPPLAPARTGPLPPRAVITAVVIAVVALVAVLFAVLNGSSGTPNPRTSAPPAAPHRQSSSPSQSVPPANTPRPVHRTAPLAAGPISRVTLTPAQACTAGATCTVTVKAWLRPPGLSGLTWRVALVDRCTGRSHPIESGSMVAEPGWHAPYTTIRVHLPQKSSLALLAVVDSPVSVSSRPLYVPAGGGTCG